VEHGKARQAAWYAAWRGSEQFRVYDHASDEPKVAGRKQNSKEVSGVVLKPGGRGKNPSG